LSEILREAEGKYSDCGNSNLLIADLATTGLETHLSKIVYDRRKIADVAYNLRDAYDFYARHLMSHSWGSSSANLEGSKEEQVGEGVEEWVLVWRERRIVKKAGRRGFKNRLSMFYW
jgi:hypothetical protein